MVRKITKLLLNSLNKISRQTIFNLDWKHRIPDSKKIIKDFNGTRNNNGERSFIHIKDMPLEALLYFLRYITVSTTRYPRIGLFWKMFLYRMLREEEILKMNFATLGVKNELMIPSQSRGIKTSKKLYQEETTPKKPKQETIKAQELLKGKTKLDKNVKGETVKAQEVFKSKNIKGRELKPIALPETSKAHKLSGEKLPGKDLKSIALPDTSKAQKISSLKEDKLLGKELKANYQLESSKAQKLSGKDEIVQEIQDTAKAQLLSGFEDNIQYLKTMEEIETTKAHAVSKAKSPEKGIVESNVKAQELSEFEEQIETSKAPVVSKAKNVEKAIVESNVKAQELSEFEDDIEDLETMEQTETSKAQTVSKAKSGENIAIVESSAKAQETTKAPVIPKPKSAEKIIIVESSAKAQETTKAQGVSKPKSPEKIKVESSVKAHEETPKVPVIPKPKSAEKITAVESSAKAQEETAKAQGIPKPKSTEKITIVSSAKAHEETPKAQGVSKPKSTEKVTVAKKSTKAPELFDKKEPKETTQPGQKLSNVKNEKPPKPTPQDKPKSQKLKPEKPQRKETKAQKLEKPQDEELKNKTPEPQVLSGFEDSLQYLKTVADHELAKAQLLSGFDDSLRYLIESTKSNELPTPKVIEYEKLPVLELQDVESEIEKSFEIPPRQKCRLSCPLPPTEFLPPEITESRTSFLSPKLKFLSLPDQFLPNPDTAKKVAPPPQDLPKMKALLFEPKTLKLRFDAVDAPIKIYKDEILVEVAYSGVCRTDLFITEGKVSCGEQPIILGHEISGRAYAVGKDVHHVIPGDRVAVNPYTACYVCRYCSRGLFSGCQNEGVKNSIGLSKNGGWAEFVVVKKSQVHKVPDQLELQQAVLIPPLSCVLSAMSKMKILREMDILIQGLGLQGCLWASVLHSQGHKNVIVCDKTSKRRSKFVSLGTNYPLVSPEDLRAKAVDVVVDCTGSRDSIERSLNALNPNGQICFFAKPQPVTEIRFSPYEIIQKELTIIGNSGNSFHFSEAIDMAFLMKDRYLQLDKLGVKTFKLENFREAFELQKAEKVSKIIFRLES